MIQSHLNFLRTKGGSEPTQQTHLAMIGYFCDTTLTSQKSQQMHDQWSHLVLSELLLIFKKKYSGEPVFEPQLFSAHHFKIETIWNVMLL